MSILDVFGHVSPRAIIEAIEHISEGEFAEAGQKIAKSFAIREIGNALRDGANNSDNNDNNNNDNMD